VKGAGLRQWAEERGYRIAWGDVGLLDEVRQEIENRREAGELDEELYRRQLAPRYRPRASAKPPRTGTMVMVAVPRPAHRLVFPLPGGVLETVVPPSYLQTVEVHERVRRDLMRNCLEEGRRLVTLRAPLKAVAARLGLVAYGRNNITYVPGLGSYFQLVGLLTDAHWGPMPTPMPARPAMLSDCRDCDACRRACPTGAVSGDRFLLRAERCLTLYTEIPDPWPEWLDTKHHHCLVGCMTCQEVCPHNRGRLRWETVQAPFTAAETRDLLDGGDGDNGAAGRMTPAEVGARWVAVGLSYEDVLGRNLRLLRRG